MAENKAVMVPPRRSLQSGSGDRLPTMEHEETVERRGREEAGACCRAASALTFLTHPASLKLLDEICWHQPLAALF